MMLIPITKESMDYNQFKQLPVDEAIKSAAAYSGFSPEEVHGVWRTESAMGSNKGPSSAGAVGDFQIMPETQASLESRMGIKFDPTDFHDSLFMGAEVLRENLQHFGNKQDALRAYNSGWDKSKWDNPETAAYTGKVLGIPESSEQSAVTDVYANTAKLPPFLKTQARREALDASGLADPTNAGELSDTFKAVHQPDPQDGMYDEDARRLAFSQQHAGFGEAFLDSMVYNTVTGALKQAWDKGTPDPTFDPTSENNRHLMEQAGVYGNESMRDFATGAVNQDDFRHRLEVSMERMDLQRRIQDTPGMSAEAGAFIGSMADPAGVLMSMGAGAGAAAIRGAAAAGRAATIARAAAGGAAENVIASELVNHENNQRFKWSTMLTDATMGAALGVMGGLITHRADPEVDPNVKPMLESAQKSIDDTKNGIADRMHDEGWTRDPNDAPGPHEQGFSTDPADGPTLDIGSTPPERYTRTEGADGAVSYKDNMSEAMYSYPVDSYNPKIGYKPEPTLANPEYTALHNAGIITELRKADDLQHVSDYQRRFGEPVPSDAKAVYIPQDDKVYVFRDRLTPEDIANPQGLVMHEVGVHYGLERSIGTENYNKVLESLTKSEDARVKEAMKAVPGDTPEHLKLEEALGYLVEKYPTLGAVQKVIADMRNWLRENVGMFKDMRLSTGDVIAYVQGTVKKARAEGKLSADATFPHVWHGSPVKGIESLDLKHAGTGEGRAAYGYGHYVTSEKGTALDYRNKETQRRGSNPEDGGLYRLKVNADQTALLDWEGAVPDSLRKAFPDVELGDTGESAYKALDQSLGSQKAASEALAKAGVPGLKYKTGRTREGGVPNHNYVMFSNDALSMEARYSRSGDTKTLDNWELGPHEEKVKDFLMQVNDTIDPNMQQQIDRTQAWLNSGPGSIISKKAAKWALSPGVAMSTSNSKLARKAGALLFENSMGSDGRPAFGSVAMSYDQIYHGYRDTVLSKMKPLIIGMLTSREKLAHWFGSKAGTTRVSDLVAEELSKHRNAMRAGVEYKSTAPEGVQRMAEIYNEHIAKMVDQGVAAGGSYAKEVKGLGVEGFMPQVWDWRKLQAAQVENPTAWEAIKKNFTQQYTERQVDPAIKAMEDAGGSPADIAALRDRLMTQVNYQVETRMFEGIRDPNSRTAMDTGTFENMASQLLTENWHGENLTHAVIGEFKDKLRDLVKDRSRTEFDMLRNVDGVRLLDYLDHDVVSMAAHTSHRFAGQTAMAKHGFKDPADFEAMIRLLHKDGASPTDVENAQFAGRAFGFLPMVLKDNELLASLRNFTAASMLGKLGFAQLADLANTVTSLGIKSLPDVFGGMLSPETPVYKQLVDTFGHGLTGTDYRLQSMTADIQPNGRVLGSANSHLLLASQRASEVVGWISGSNFVNHALHKAFLPIMLERFVDAAHGLHGGMSKARLADAGLTEGTLARIKAQLDKHEPNREKGDRFQWDKWDDQYAADRMIDAIHRVTATTLQRGLIGEAPMWRSESAVGALASQLHNFGMTAMEKQLARNLAIGGLDTYLAMGLGLSWSAFLYYSRLHVNTLGMSNDQKKEYMAKNTTPAQLTQGVLQFFNMSGIAAEVAGLGVTVFGGSSYGGGSLPVASAGFLGNVIKGTTSIGNLIKGSEHPNKDAVNAMKWLPGANSIPGTYLQNTLKYQ